MKKKIVIHLVFFLILEVIFIIFNWLYSRDIELWESAVWYLGLTLILFCINLIKRRRNKWIVIGIICALHLYLTIDDLNRPAVSDHLLDLVWHSAPVNIPFVTQYLSLSWGKVINNTVMYVVYFYGAILYWYLVYRLSKMIVKKGQLCLTKRTDSTL